MPEPTSAAMSGAVTAIEYHGAVADRARAVPWGTLRGDWGLRGGAGDDGGAGSSGAPQVRIRLGTKRQ